MPARTAANPLPFHVFALIQASREPPSDRFRSGDASGFRLWAGAAPGGASVTFNGSEEDLCARDGVAERVPHLDPERVRKGCRRDTCLVVAAHADQSCHWPGFGCGSEGDWSRRPRNTGGQGLRPSPRAQKPGPCAGDSVCICAGRGSVNGAASQRGVEGHPRAGKRITEPIPYTNRGLHGDVGDDCSGDVHRSDSFYM